ncbi:GNAT family N-acetyltransferase [Aureispira anguillae]|uniref:GNAT family N-acetyltransferase n=1 Tax=Aureispira anguillae TaxID=2864201 RepID=A0A915YFX2_9BACT|nr:GNAT family N-acetyltransferase [Aureispira anguillae]BDS12289.1 GNAT family N-acetyltransferase [Aureispira anguillae]
MYSKKNKNKLFNESLIVKRLTEHQKIPFNLLELADPSRAQIEQYLYESQCYLALLEAQCIGVLVLKELSAQTVEIKNIAIKEIQQGKGYGKKLLKWATKIAQESNYQKIRIGTGNSSIGQLALYQKEGFEITQIVKDFFTHNYPNPIVENGILCKHMIILEKDLNEF